MAVDIAPEILNDIMDHFEGAWHDNEKLPGLMDKLKSGTATYAEANEYAAEVGRMMKEAYAANLSSDRLPNGKCYYNIADKIIRDTEHMQYIRVSDYTRQVQQELNKKAGIGLKAITPDEDKGLVQSLINKAANADQYDDVAAYVSQTIESMSKKVVDHSVKANADFQYKAGMRPKIIRSGGSGCCEWCSGLSGKYDYPDVPDDVYARHNNCSCTVEYVPGDGKRQNVWSKNWISEEEAQRREKLKTLGLDTEDKHAKIKYRKSSGLPAAGDNVGIRIRNVPEKITEPSSAEMTRRMIAGQSNPNNQGVIAKKIIDGEYSLKLKHQKYLQHIEGTPQYLSATEGRKREQSVLYISEDKTQELIYKYAGMGEAKILKDGSIGNKEYISVDEIIGKYFERGEWHETSRIQIMYGKEGSHIVPVKER